MKENFDLLLKTQYFYGDINSNELELTLDILRNIDHLI